MFRRATLPDVPQVARLVREFYVGQNYEVTYGIGFDYESTLRTVTTVIDRGICITSGDACAGAYVLPFPYNHSAKVGYVQFWYFRKPSGIKILSHLFEELKKEGATHVWSVSHPPHHRIARLYQRLGLRQVEGVWGKALGTASPAVQNIPLRA